MDFFIDLNKIKEAKSRKVIFFFQETVVRPNDPTNPTESQIKPKSKLACCRFSQKRMDEFDLFAVKEKEQTKQIRPFIFWENLWRANLLL